MKIKVGNQIIDANDQPIMLILSDEDKENIAKMHPDAYHYCCFPDTMSKEEAEAFMDLPQIYKTSKAKNYHTP